MSVRNKGQNKLHISPMALWRTVSVIGTANRDNDSRMDSALFDRMVTATHEAICARGRSPETTQLVSGGAAWADHVAVRLFTSGLGYGSLRLCLPAPWDAEAGCFVDTAPAAKGAPGARTNQLHAVFSRGLQIDSLVCFFFSSCFHSAHHRVSKSCLPTLCRTKSARLSRPEPSGAYIRGLRLETSRLPSRSWSWPSRGGRAASRLAAAEPGRRGACVAGRSVTSTWRRCAVARSARGPRTVTRTSPNRNEQNDQGG
jgi:hypothetical protein